MNELGCLLVFIGRSLNNIIVGIIFCHLKNKGIYFHIFFTSNTFAVIYF